MFSCVRTEAQEPLDTSSFPRILGTAGRVVGHGGKDNTRILYNPLIAGSLCSRLNDSRCVLTLCTMSTEEHRLGGGHEAINREGVQLHPPPHPPDPAT